MFLFSFQPLVMEMVIKQLFLNLLSALPIITSIIVTCTSLASNQIELGKNLLPRTVLT